MTLCVANGLVNTQATVSGSNFLFGSQSYDEIHLTMCRFNGNIITTLSITDTAIICEVISSLTCNDPINGLTNITPETTFGDGKTYFEKSQAYYLVVSTSDYPFITHITPVFDANNQSTTITLFGVNFELTMSLNGIDFDDHLLCIEHINH